MRPFRGLDLLDHLGETVYTLLTNIHRVIETSLGSTFKMLQGGLRSLRHLIHLPCRPWTCRRATQACVRQNSTSAPIPHQSAPPPRRNPLPRAPMSAPIQSQHPNLGRQRQAKQWPPSDAGIKWVALGGLVGVPILSYFWYNHRKDHMYNKKHQLLREAQARYQASTQK